MSSLSEIFQGIANSIRSKAGGSDTYKPTEMAEAINNLPSGGVTVTYNDGTGWTNEGVASAVTLPNIGTFNYPVNIEDGIESTAFMFYGASNFNQPITIPNSVTSTVHMFSSASALNQPITIPNSVTNTAYMFYGAVALNQPITIPNSVTNMAYMFYSAVVLNQPITIPNSVTSTVHMFDAARNFNQPITIPNSVTNTAYMFSGALNFNQPITIPNTALSKSRTRGMLGQKNRLLRVNIYTNNFEPFTGTAASNSIVGAAITWTSDTNVMYNTVYNIYIYNNY